MSLARVAQQQQPITPRTPHTPGAHTLPATETPNGTWRHPQFDQIAKRQYATTFDHTNFHTIFKATGIILLSFYPCAAFAFVAWLLNWIFWLGLSTSAPVVRYITPWNYVPGDYPLDPAINAIYHVASYIDPVYHWLTLSVRTILVAVIVYNLWPLLRRYRPDDIADIPLTPSQRAALGLKASVPTQTPGSAYASPNYVTPPRYARSTPRSSSFSSQDQSASPFARSNSGSPFSPGQSFGVSTSSPLFQRAMNTSSAKRPSYGTGELGSSLFSGSESSGPGTPTPVVGKASVGLNNKWLYEKRRDSPRSSLFA